MCYTNSLLHNSLTLEFVYTGGVAMEFNTVTAKESPLHAKDDEHNRVGHREMTLVTH